MPADETAPQRSGSTRRLPLMLLIVAAAFLVARVGTGIYEHGHTKESGDQDKVVWRLIPGAEAEARMMHKPLLYDFTADWCPPCQMMRREVFADAPSAETINRLCVPVKVLDRSREEGKNPPLVEALQSRFKIDGFPTLVVVSPDGGDSVVVGVYAGREQTMQMLVEGSMKVGLAMRQNSGR